jgi:hypothetical protein
MLGKTSNRAAASLTLVFTTRFTHALRQAARSRRRSGSCLQTRSWLRWLMARASVSRLRSVMSWGIDEVFYKQMTTIA